MGDGPFKDLGLSQKTSKTLKNFKRGADEGKGEKLKDRLRPHQKIIENNRKKWRPLCRGNGEERI